MQDSMFKTPATLLLAASLAALVVWATQSVLSLVLVPTFLGLSSLVVDSGGSIFSNTSQRYRFGVVQYVALVLFGLGGTVALLVMGPP